MTEKRDHIAGNIIWVTLLLIASLWLGVTLFKYLWFNVEGEGFLSALVAQGDPYDLLMRMAFTSAVAVGGLSVARVMSRLAVSETNALKQQEELRRSLAEQEAIAYIIRLSLFPIRLEEMLQQALAFILSRHTMSFQRKGSIFITDESTNELRMSAHVGLSSENLKNCETVASGHCLCGRAFEATEIVYVNELCHRHETRYPGIRPHGHYCVPIRSDGTVLGVLNLYVPEGHERDDAEDRFVRIVADALASIIRRKLTEDLLERTHSDLETSVEALLRSNADLQKFVYVASHDLREPLRMVTSFTQLIERDLSADLKPKTRQYMDFVIEGAKRMDALLRDLLAYSQVDSSLADLTAVDSAIALQEALDNLAAILDETKGVVTSRQLPPVKANHHQLVQLFQNLIGNSLKYRQPEVQPAIEVTAEVHEGVATFVVSDNGIGIDPKFKNRIFEIFQRLHNREQYDGTGVGLAICKRIVEHHRGRVWVESESGKGCTFFFTLPAA